MKKKEKYITIYTVSSTDDCDSGTDHCVIGSYRTRGRALDECVDYILQRLDARYDLAYAMANDENHTDAAPFFNVDCDVKDEAGLRKYLYDSLYADGCYYVFDGSGLFHFDIDENDLVG
jgi:hypothetical protein